MSDLSLDRQTGFRSAIDRFLQGRRDAKLDDLVEGDPKRENLIAQFVWADWINDAARRVEQIQAVTHSLKPIHPDARGTNLYCRPDTLPQHYVVGTHALQNDFIGDVVGNAAALDVYKFLRLDVDGRTLLDWMLDDDADLKAVLSSDPKQASAWIIAFTGLVHPRTAVASHTLAKQVYWLTSDDPRNNGHYHLLAPLYASSLAHAVFKVVDENRFGEPAKEARKARWEKRDHDTGYADYPDLAVQKLGGTKPQNISQLNSERGGKNYLLGSLPPKWKAGNTPRLKPGQSSIFDGWLSHLDVWFSRRELKDFLQLVPDQIMETREQRDRLSARLVELVLMLAKPFQSLPPGWTKDAHCQLAMCEQLWLDPFRSELDLEFRQIWKWWDWPDQVCIRFGNWVNSELTATLPVGDLEYRHWARELSLHSDWLYELEELKEWLSGVEKSETKEGAST